MMDRTQLLWEKYKQEVEMHRGYLDLALKLNVFYFAITGAIISFYFLHIHEEPLVRYSLILPLVMSLGLGVFLWAGSNLSKESQQEFETLAKELNFRVFSAIAHVLEPLLRIFSVFLFLVAAGLAILIFKDIDFYWLCR